MVVGEEQVWGGEAQVCVGPVEERVSLGPVGCRPAMPGSDFGCIEIPARGRCKTSPRRWRQPPKLWIGVHST